MGSSQTVEQTISKVLEQISKVSSVKVDVATAIAERGGVVPSVFARYGDTIRGLVEENVLGYVLSPSGTEWPACITSFVMPSAVLAVEGSSRVLCLPDSVTGIDLNQVNRISGSGCFAVFSGVEVVMGSSVLEISAEYAFGGCRELKELHFPLCSSFGSASSAFHGCKTLTVVDMPAVTELPGECFYACTQLSEVSFPACVTVGSRAFRSCFALASVDLPACTAVRENAFRDCTSLRVVSLPVVESIGDGAFAGASIGSLYLQSVLSVPKIDSAKFSVTDLWVPSSLYSEFQSAQYWSTYAAFIRSAST